MENGPTYSINKGSCAKLIRRLKYQKSGKIRNTITKSKRPSNADRKNQTNSSRFYKVLNKNTSLAERIRTLFREHGITIFLILTALSITISTILLVIAGVFGGGERGGGGGGRRSCIKRRRGFEKMVIQVRFSH